DVLEQTEIMIALQTTGPNDQRSIADWGKGKGSPEQVAEMMGSLSRLKKGEAWIFSPQALDVFQCVHIRQRETFNSSATPKVGEKRIEPKKLAQVDLEHLKTRMAETIEKAKADDPRELKRQIAELQRQVKKAASAPPVSPSQGDEVRALRK